MNRGIIILFGLLIILAGLAQTAKAQRFAPYYRLRVIRFNVEWEGVRDNPNIDQYTGYLKWEITENYPDPGVYYIKFRASEKDGVFHITRILPGRNFEVYGLGETLIKNSKKKGLKVTLAENVDLKQPYVIKKQKGEYLVFNYQETTFIQKLFDVLNQWLYLKMIPKANGKPYEHNLFQLTDLEMGRALTFIGRKEWRWRN